MLTVVVVLLATGCSWVVEGYGSGERDDTGVGGAGGDLPDGPPILPAIPDTERKDACEQCAVDECGERYQACLDEPSCEQMLRCKGPESDPDALLACDDAYPESWHFDAYWECVFGASSECIDDCGTGRNFGCASSYRWEGSAESEVTLELKVRRFGPLEEYLAGNDELVGARVRLCSELGCEHGALRHDYETTDSGGRVSFTYLSNAAVFGEISEGTVGDRLLHYDAPVLRDARREATFYGREWRQFIMEGNADVEELPVVWTQTLDCLGTPAIGVDVTLEGADGALRAVGAGDFTGDLTPADGRATFYNLVVPESQKVAVVVFSSPAERLSLARREVVAREGWWTEVKLYPHVQGDGQTVR